MKYSEGMVKTMLSRNYVPAFLVVALVFLIGLPIATSNRLTRIAEVSAHETDLQNPPTKPKEEDPVPVNTRTREAPMLESAPIGPGQFGTFLSPQINNRGDIAFVGRYPVSGGPATFGQGVFVRSADGKWSAVRDVDKAKNLDETGFGFSQFALNEQGDVTLTAAFGKKPPIHSDTHGGTTPAPPAAQGSNEKNLGIFSKTAQGFVNHFSLGQEVPNMPSRFSSFSNPSMNSKGTMAFIAAYVDPDGRALFISENGKLRIAARSGQRLKPNEPQVFSEHYYPSRINERGEVAFLARVGVGAGIFVLRSTGIEMIAIDGAPSPVPGAKYLGFANRTPAINDKGEVAFAGFYDGPNAGRALFFKGVTGPTKLVATSTDKTGKYQFKDFLSPAINNQGDIAFMGTLEGGIRSGIFLKTAKGIELIALVGDLPPGRKPGEEFNNFQQQPSLNDRGEVVFYAQLKNATVGVFIKDAKGLRPLVMRGDKTPVID
jgi:hypothetical protein